MAPRDILDEALKLPLVERGRLVQKLIKSLDEAEAEEPSVVERAWAAELEERAQRALAGKSSARDLDDVCDDLESKHREKT
jgi:putative addiction module component (TIGR02574 family)